MFALMKLIKYVYIKSVLHYTRTPVSMVAMNSNTTANKNKHALQAQTSVRVFGSQQPGIWKMFLRSKENVTNYVL